MHKQLAIHIAVIIAVLAVVLPVALTMHSTTVGGKGHFSMGGSIATTFNLQVGQNVAGWFNFTGCPYGTGFNIVDPNHVARNANDSMKYDFGVQKMYENYTFTSRIDGEWFIYVRSGEAPYLGDYTYSYTVGPTPILGLDRINFIGWVIAGGVISELAVFFYYRRKKADTSIKT